MKKINLFICGLMLFQLSFSQIDNRLNNSDVFYNYRFVRLKDNAGKLKYSDINGSPYFSNEPVKSVVYLRDTSVSVVLHYDLYQDEIEFNNGKSTFWIIKEDVKYIQYGQVKFIVSEFENGKNKERSYFEPLVTGNYQLLKRKKIKLLPAEPAKAYQDPVPERFSEPEVMYYIKYQESPAELITGKNFHKKLPSDISDKTSEFIKKENLKVSKETDLIKLVNYINSL